MTRGKFTYLQFENASRGNFPNTFFFSFFKKNRNIYMEKDTQKIEQIEKSYLRGYLNIFTASHHLSGFQKIDITAVNFTKKKFKVI